MTSEWTSHGEQYCGTQQKKDAVLEEALRLEWHDLEPIALGVGTLTLPMMQGIAIQEMMNNIAGNKLAIAWNGVLENRYGFYGMRVEHDNGRVLNSYWLDTGTALTCILLEEVEDEEQC